MYLGWARYGASGAAVVGLAFVLPSFVMVLALAIGYIRFGGLPWMQGAVFGSGLAIVPFLHGGVVQDFGWLDERQFLDAVAVAMITPGPVVITVAFIGYLVAGVAGAVVAGAATFVPCYLFTVVPAPHFRRWSRIRPVRAFVDGVTAAATGAIAGAVFVLGRRALVDVATVAIALVALLLLTRVKRLPEPFLMAARGASWPAAPAAFVRPRCSGIERTCGA